MTVALTSVKPEIPRDRYGRPQVVGPQGGIPVPYTRVTTLAGTLEDHYALGRWQQRMTMLGLVDRPELIVSVSAFREDKRELDRIADAAMDAAQARASAVVGTALHALCERIDLGEDVGLVPGDYQRDLDAYAATTEPLAVLAAERFVVLDDLRVGGSFDRLVRFEGENYVADIKTGSIDGALKIACQLALYAHGTYYDVRTGERSPLPGVNGQRALVIHLPAGSGTCRLVWVNIAAGWEAVQLAADVRSWHKRRDLYEAWSVASALDTLHDAEIVDDGDWLAARVDAAESVDDLAALWREHRDRWTPKLTAQAARRKTELSGGIA
jgi:hypothetical protein